MLFQTIEGRRLYSVGAFWFKLSKEGMMNPHSVALRQKQILFYCNGDQRIAQALIELAHEGVVKSYDKEFLKEVKYVVERMKNDGVGKRRL